MFTVPAHTEIVDALQAEFGDSIQQTGEPYGMLTISVSKDKLLAVIAFLKSEKMGFTFLTDICGIHYESTDELGTIYHLHNLYKNIRLRIKTRFPKSAAVVDSLTPLFAGANWMERETYDFFGIDFKGHPDLRRILNVDDMDYFPLRKEYALEDQTRSDKDDSMFGR